MREPENADFAGSNLVRARQNNDFTAGVESQTFGLRQELQHFQIINGLGSDSSSRQ